MSRRLDLLITALLLALATPLRAQAPPTPGATLPERFQSWRPAEPLGAGRSLGTRFVTVRPNRGRHALLGGVIGAAAGVVFCTAVSTLADDSADGGLSFCPLDSYLLIGGAGFALGFGIGWIA